MRKTFSYFSYLGISIALLSGCDKSGQPSQASVPVAAAPTAQTAANQATEPAPAAGTVAVTP